MSVLECLWCFSSKSVRGIQMIINESHIVFCIVDSARYFPSHRASLVKGFPDFKGRLTAWRAGARDELNLPLLPIVFATRRSPESHVIGLKHLPICFLGDRMTAIFAFLICENCFFSPSFVCMHWLM